MHNLLQFLERSCASGGGRIAVEASDGMLDFDGLRGAALRVAGHIRAVRGRCCEKMMVAVYLPKGAKCLCAMLGALYSGNVYVPMDCRAPINRTKLIFDIIEPILVITDAAGRKQLAGAGVAEGLLAVFDDVAAPVWLLSGAPAGVEGGCGSGGGDAVGVVGGRGCGDDTGVEGGCGDDSAAEGECVVVDATTLTDMVSEVLSQVQDTDPAYLLFTSGSTGVPKGVVIPHRRVINYINWAVERFSITDGEIIGSQAPFYFTVSAMDIYLALATGSRLCIIPENLFSSPEKLLNHITEHMVTLIFWVSSVYHHVAQADALGNFSDAPLPALRRAWFVGEPMPSQSLAYWMKRLPGVEFVNMYGSTETDMTIHYIVPHDHPPEMAVPLGAPCANTDVLVLKDGIYAAQPGELGEICVRGSCLALGYYKDDEKTQAGFTQNPLHNNYPDIIYHTGDLGELRDGLLIFHGRRDHQFKHLGYRIEAGEIEAVAARFDGVRNACVLYDGEKRQIVLFFEADVADAADAADTATSPVDELAYRRALMADLPIYMVPTRFVRLDSMPFNANKKKDRMLLKATYIEEKIQ